MEMIIYLKKKTQVCALLLSLTLIALTEALNVLIGLEISLAALYLLPVALTTWAIGARTAYLLSFICIAIMMINIKLQEDIDHQLVSYWDAGMHLGFFLLIVVLISQLRATLRERERIIQEKLNAALGEIKILKAFLPICASCKKIRDEEGRWVEVEHYISLHTNTVFSHGICPDCRKKLYPDFSPK